MSWIRAAKASRAAVIFVGHVTKDGAIAGPRVLEHMVDCVLYFEGGQVASFPYSAWREKPIWCHRRNWCFRNVRNGPTAGSQPV